jgi:NAD-dependent deacetylase
MRQIFLDTETTGLSADAGHRIVEIACIEVVNGKPTGREFHHYLDPQCEVPAEAAAIHGLTSEFLKGKPLFIDIAAELIEFVAGAEVLIHNAPFDLAFLDRELCNSGIRTPFAHLCSKVTDTLPYFRALFPGERCALQALCDRFQIACAGDDRWHTALTHARKLGQLWAAISIPDDLVIALKEAKHVVVFTGAGVSAESGIPTFRDSLTGLWERFNAEDLATPSAFRKDPALVWGWYEWRRMKVLLAQPNPAHLAIAALANHIPKLTVVTQNVDDLHERAGSANVLHLHGSLHDPRCFTCGQAHTFAPGIPDEPEGGRRLSPPVCGQCGGHTRPGVVWFGEDLPVRDLHRAYAHAKDCDLFFSIGTSGMVYPAAQIPGLARQAGAKVVQINPISTGLDRECNWSLRGAAGTLLPRLMQAAFQPRMES